MSLNHISRVLVAAIVVVAIGELFSSSNVAAGLFGTRFLDQTGCCRRCPACDYVCNLDAEQVDEEKTCFEVESKVICIPRVVFPWQKKKSCGSCDSCDGRGCSDCVHNGARTRKICVLKSKKYKCPKCEYTWSAEKKPCGGACDGGCDSGCAAAGCDTANYGVVIESAPVYSDSPSDAPAPVAVEDVDDVLPAASK